MVEITADAQRPNTSAGERPPPPNRQQVDMNGAAVQRPRTVGADDPRMANRGGAAEEAGGGVVVAARPAARGIARRPGHGGWRSRGGGARTASAGGGGDDAERRGAEGDESLLDGEEGEEGGFPGGPPARPQTSGAGYGGTSSRTTYIRLEDSSLADSAFDATMGAASGFGLSSSRSSNANSAARGGRARMPKRSGTAPAGRPGGGKAPAGLFSRDRNRRQDAQHFLLKQAANRHGGGGRKAKHQQAWVGSPSTNKELTYSGTANRHIVNEQAIPPDPFGPPPEEMVAAASQLLLRRRQQQPQQQQQQQQGGGGGGGGALSRRGKRQKRRKRAPGDGPPPSSIAGRVQSLREALWAGSPSSQRELSYSGTANRHIRNKQEIPVYNAAFDERCPLAQSGRFRREQRALGRMVRHDAEDAKYERRKKELLLQREARDRLAALRRKKHERKMEGNPCVQSGGGGGGGGRGGGGGGRGGVGAGVPGLGSSVDLADLRKSSSVTLITQEVAGGGAGGAPAAGLGVAGGSARFAEGGGVVGGGGGAEDAKFAREALDSLPRRVKISGSARTTMSSSSERTKGWHPQPPPPGLPLSRAPSPLVPIDAKRGGKKGPLPAAPSPLPVCADEEESMIMV
jgi:hypothetical protein